MILIIAYGNSLRGDDGAGLVLAERLEEAWQGRQVEVERVVLAEGEALDEQRRAGSHRPRPGRQAAHTPPERRPHST